jgi:hypothetical protein
MSGEEDMVQPIKQATTEHAGTASRSPGQGDLLAALLNVRKIISEGAATGFNCHDGDWAERLFASQAMTTAAIAKAEVDGSPDSGVAGTVYQAMTLLLKAGSFVRLELSMLGDDEFSVGFHPGFADGDLVVQTGKDEMVFCREDQDWLPAREFAAALLAWADWVEMQPVGR